MFAIICRKIPTWVPPKERIVLSPKLVVFVKSFSSSGVCRNDPEKSFTVSYLINSCGLPSKDALVASKKLRIKSPQKPDEVLELLKKYGFTNAQILGLVNRWPSVLSANPKKTLLPKLEFFCSIGVPLPILAERLSFHPSILHHSLENCIIPWYNCLKSVVQSDKRVANVLVQATRAFNSIPTKIALLRELGLPESSIALLLVQKPSLTFNSEEKLAAYVDRAIKMGFDKTKAGLIYAVQVFGDMSETTLKHKMEVYRRCGWSDSDINTAFSKFPICMKLSEKKIMANMNFLVTKMGLNPVAVAQHPSLLSYSLEKRMKPRCLVARILNAKGLKKMVSAATLLTITEEKFLKRFIVLYQNDIPQLLDIYQGKLKIDSVKM